MKAVALIAVMPMLIAAAQKPSPRELADMARPLTTTEIATVLSASRKALAAKTLRLPSLSDGHGPEVLMGPAGQPKIIRTTSGIVGGIVSGTASGSPAPPPEISRYEDVLNTIIDFTGRPARRCDGSIEQGEMVVEYTRLGSAQAWTATARRRGSRGRFGEVGSLSAFEMLRGAGSIASGERGEIGDRRARAFVSDWTSPEDPGAGRRILTGDPLPNVAGEPVPNEMIQTLWIDTRSLLPLRWEVSRRGVRTYGFDFIYQAIDLRPPANVAAPRCIR